MPFDTHSKANLQTVAISKEFKTFFRKTRLFSNKKPKILNVWRNLTISVAFYGTFATLSDFRTKIHFFFEKTIYFLSQKTQILNVLKTFSTSVATYGKFATNWWKKSDTWTTDLGSFTRAQLANIG